MWERERNMFDPWIRKIPLGRKWQPTPVFLPGKSHGQRSLVGYSPWDHKELDTTKRTRAHTYTHTHTHTHTHLHLNPIFYIYRMNLEEMSIWSRSPEASTASTFSSFFTHGIWTFFFFFCPQSIQSRKRFTVRENIINTEKLLRILYTPSIALRTSNNTHHLLKPLKIIIFLDEEVRLEEFFITCPNSHGY